MCRDHERRPGEIRFPFCILSARHPRSRACACEVPRCCNGAPSRIAEREVPMSGLVEILARYTDDSPDFGGSQRLDPERLRRDLTEIGRRNGKFFSICVAMLAVLFFGEVVLVWVSLSHPKQVAAVLAVTGVSFPFVIKTMLSLWKEKVATDI